MGKLLALQPKQTEPIDILYCGHSCVILTTPSGKRIIIDPWLKGNPSCPSTLHDPLDIDYILLTHGHSDHIGCTIDIAKKNNAQIFAIFELAMLILAEGLPSNLVQPMNKGGSLVLSEDTGLTVSLTHALHSNSYKAQDGKIYYAGEACGLIVNLESGPVVYHAGDTCLFSDMRLIHDRYNPQIVFLPIGDRYTMGPFEAAEAVKLLKPEISIPIHFGPTLSGTPEDFVKFTEHMEAKTIVLQPGESYRY